MLIQFAEAQRLVGRPVVKRYVRLSAVVDGSKSISHRQP